MQNYVPNKILSKIQRVTNMNEIKHVNEIKQNKHNHTDTNEMIDRNWLRYFNHGSLRWNLKDFLKQKWNIENMENAIIFVIPQNGNYTRILFL